MSQFINLMGKRFDRWLVVFRMPNRRVGKSTQTYYLCRCDCEIEKEINSRYLRERRTKSCGCYEREEAIKRMSNNNPMKNPEVAEKVGDIRKKAWLDPNSNFNSEEYHRKQVENSYWLGKKRPDMSIRFKGKNNPMFGKREELSPVWNNGSSFEPYAPEFNKELKEKIREKFNHICVLCGKSAKIPHHIDYNKKNNKEENFVLLCGSCNTKVNFNRDQWEIGFKIFIDGAYKRVNNEILQ